MDRLDMRQIWKEFGGIAALSGAGFSARAGEVHALMGENGAGKSTLMKILAGAYSHDGGEIRIGGEPVSITNPQDAIRNGVSIIYQEFSLASDLTVAENILIETLGHGMFVNRRAMHARAAELLARMGFDDIDPGEIAGGLTIARQQVVEICKALSRDCSILVLDEPTAVLTTHETEKLFNLVRRLRDQGVCIVYISHRLDEIFSLCDRVTVLKDGATVGTWETGALDHTSLVNLMIGRELKDFFPERQITPGPVALEVDALAAGGLVSDISFTVRRGEVLGIGGLVGAGRTEVLRAIFGADPVSAGEIRIDGRPRTIRSPGDAVRAGIGLVPEDRKQQGCLLDLPILNNAMLTPVNPHLGFWGLIREARERGATEALRSRLNLKAASIDAEAGTLSGGNQQKVAIMKWLVSGCEILLLDEPTRGVDVGAKVEIYRVINELAANGAAIVMVSSEMLELIGMCDRVIVMRAGRLAGELSGEELTEEGIIELAMGRKNVH
ncbi:sugar ABC transporter ATP-binding protein [Shinella sp. CPCC 100929]|uniref:Sugar ABC transporter ATP-binding protein n=1 Tax=Shinella lacus TaxID=2654216 RepID=A0ABT1R015_9HYPH|nr:sugar ABC transporter ATP-binding protein [Shinella lacus]MCQ4628517.1 sugar ABC transporter ATP-binding protein [Shinella lacus]